MKTRFLIIAGIVGIIIISATVLHTELLGEGATFGQCIISVSGNSGGYSSESSAYENQCKQSCVHAGSLEKNEIRNATCKFQTISGYGWVASPQEFEYIIDRLSLNPLH